MTNSPHQSESPAHGRAAVAAVLIVVASVVIGVASGFIWAAISPRVLYQVYTLNPPTAYATNPETSAFIAADGWFCLIAVVGGAVIGLLGYLVGVRRYGPVPMAGIVTGATAAAFICRWLGHRQSGGAGFNHVLATSKPGALLHAPISLGSQGALAFWPVAAAAVAGGIVLLGVLRGRHQAGYNAAPIPGMDALGQRPSLASPDSQPGQSHPEPADRPGSSPDGQGPDLRHRPGQSLRSSRPAEDPRGQSGGPDHRGGDPGRAAP
ncbi:MAG TPA: hypothetical protein VEV45_07240 [Streptosporangiaceae bacterium]|nr:hypothetical protein [Streptosporangiaceae bacterium]